MKDLLQLPFVGKMLRAPWFWRFWRLVVLGLFLLAILFGWHHHRIPGVEVPDPLMYTNFTTFSLWVVWIMGLVLLALGAGRIWCAVCPMGWLNGLLSRFGLNRSLPHWLNNLYPVTLLLVALQVAVYLFSIHRYPDYTAQMLVVLLVALAVSSLVFRQRAFCQLFCPAGAVLRCYSRVAPFELRVKSQEVCAGCESVQCVSEEPYWRRISCGPAVVHLRQQRPGCPVAIEPREIDDNADCTLCMNCVENCCNDNLRLGVRPWLAELGGAVAARGEAFLLLVLLGMVTANFSKVNVPLREALFALPKKLALLLGWQADGYFLLSALWVTLLLPLLLILPGLILQGLRAVRVTRVEAPTEPAQPGPEQKRFFSFSALLLSTIPLLLAAHLVLAVVKLNAKLAYLPLVLSDMSGVKSYLAMHLSAALSQPGVLLPLDQLKWLVLLLLAIGYLLSLAAARKLSRHEEGAGLFFAGLFVNLTLLGGLYLDTVIRWLFLR